MTTIELNDQQKDWLINLLIDQLETTDYSNTSLNIINQLLEKLK